MDRGPNFRRWTIALLLTAAMVGCAPLTTRKNDALSPSLAAEVAPVKDAVELEVGKASVATGRRAIGKAGVALASGAEEPAEIDVELSPPASDDEAEVLPTPLPSAGRLGLVELEQMALANNPALTVAGARIRAAEGDRIQAGLWPNPKVGYHGTQIGNQDTMGQQGVFLRQRFITAGKLGLDQTVAARERDARRFQFDSQQLRVLSDVRIRFYEALAAQRRTRLTTVLTENAGRLVDSTRTLVENRQLAENDLLQAEIELESTRILLDNAENQQRETWRRLAAVVGLPDLAPQPLAGDLDTALSLAELQEITESVLAAHPEVSAARTRTAKARTALERALREPIPNVEAFVSVRKNNLMLGEDAVMNVELGLPLPIYDANQGGIARARADLSEACAELKRIELDLRDRLAVAWRRFANARQQAERYAERILPRSQKSLDMVAAAYENGQVEYLTLLTAQRTHYEARLKRLDALEELWRAAIELDGQLLTGSLSGGR